MAVDDLIYLFIYLYINFAKRPGSLTDQAPLRGQEKKKISNTTNKNYNTLEMTRKKEKKKRNANAKTELGRTSIKNQQPTPSRKLFNGQLVWHLIHTLLIFSSRGRRHHKQT